MRRIASFLALLLLIAFALQNQSAAENDGPSVSGSFQISTDEGLTKNVEFSARVGQDGRIIGESIFQDLASSRDQKAESEDSSSADSAAAFFVKSQFDCLIVNGNRAVMGGTITESNPRHYIGRRLLLVVQDGDGFDPPGRDKLTFGVYRQTQKGWLPMDSERPDEEVGPVSWIAQDAERPDDIPVSSAKSEIVGCESFPISSFSFFDAKHGRGSIKVRP